jgi:hypothetical protein
MCFGRGNFPPPSHCPHQVEPPTRTPTTEYRKSPLVVTKASHKRSLDTAFRFSEDNEDTIDDKDMIDDSSCVSASPGTNSVGCGLWTVDCE